MANSSVILDHAAYNDLDGDDHPQYLKKAGDTLTGDLPAFAGATIELIEPDPDVMLWGLI